MATRLTVFKLNLSPVFFHGTRIMFKSFKTWHTHFLWWLIESNRHDMKFYDKNSNLKKLSIWEPFFTVNFFTAYGPSWTFKVAQIGQKLTLTKLSAPKNKNAQISLVDTLFYYCLVPHFVNWHVFLNNLPYFKFFLFWSCLLCLIVAIVTVTLILFIVPYRGALLCKNA